MPSDLARISSACACNTRAMAARDDAIALAQGPVADLGQAPDHYFEIVLAGALATHSKISSRLSRST